MAPRELRDLLGTPRVLCKVIVCDERLAFVVELSAGGRGIQLEEWGSEWG